MNPQVNETKNSGFPLELDHGQSAPGNVKRRYAPKRKKSPLMVWGSVGALGLVAVLAALGWSLSSREADFLAIQPIAEQVIKQGDELRMRISVRRARGERGPVTYSLSGAPADAAIDARTGELCWATGEAHKLGEYKMTVKVASAGPRPLSDQQTFLVRLLRNPARPARPKPKPEEDVSALPTMGSFVNPLDQASPFGIAGALKPQGKIDELVFGKLKQLKIEPADLCPDGMFVRRVFLDTIGTLPTAEEAKAFLENKDPDKRSALIDHLLQRPEFADYWAMKWSDLLRVKAEFPINLWPYGAQAYHRWIRTALKENMPYDQFARELLTSSGSNFRTPQVNFYRALQIKKPPAIAQAVAQAFMGVRAGAWPEERWASLGVFFSQIGYKPTREWKEEIVVWDPHVAKPPASAAPPAAGSPGKTKPAADAPPPVPAFPDGTKAELPPGKDPREVFADWLIDAKNPWFSRHIVNRVWYWLLGRGIVHEPDDIRPDNPAQNLELLNWLADELIRAKYDWKHIYRAILNSTTYQLSCVPKSQGPEAAANFACYPLRRLEAEVLIDAICQVTGTTESYSSMIPEPFTFIPEKQRSIMLPDGSITSSVLEMFGRPARDTGLESERNNRMTAAQALHLLNSTHIRSKIQKGPKIQALLTSGIDSPQLAETLYLTVLSRMPTGQEHGDVDWHCDSKWGAENLVWALFNSDEFLFRH